MCAGFSDLSTLLFHFLFRPTATPQLLRCPSVDGCGSAWPPTLTTAREEKSQDLWETNIQNKAIFNITPTCTEIHAHSQINCRACAYSLYTDVE